MITNDPALNTQPVTLQLNTDIANQFQEILHDLTEKKRTFK